MVLQRAHDFISQGVSSRDRKAILEAVGRYVCIKDLEGILGQIFLISIVDPVVMAAHIFNWFFNALS